MKIKLRILRGRWNIYAGGELEFEVYETCDLVYITLNGSEIAVDKKEFIRLLQTIE